MNPWTALVHAIGSFMLSVGEVVGGGKAVGILLTTLAVRVAMIPILGPLSLRTVARQRVVRRIRPQIKALDKELKDHPDILSRRLKELHEANGIAVVDWGGLIAALVQLPILIALFQAVLELWGAESLTLAGTALGLLAGGVSVLATASSGQAEGAKWMLWMSAILPVAICLWLGPGVGLYLIAFYGAASLQALFMRGRRASLEASGPG